MLKDDVTDVTGRLLLRSGTEISELNIKIFKTWGIIEVNIQGDEAEEAKAEDLPDANPSVLNEAEKSLRELFILNDLDSPIVKELFRLCLRNKIRTMTRELR